MAHINFGKSMPTLGTSIIRNGERPAHTVVDPRITEIVGEALSTEISADNIREKLEGMGMDSIAKLRIVLGIEKIIGVEINPSAISANSNTIDIQTLIDEASKETVED